MVVQDQILVYPNATHAQLVATVKGIQRRHRPDAILWCDWAAYLAILLALSVLN